MPQLDCQSLSLAYEGNTVLSGLSFSINAGEYLCIVGENGSGKSTLMKTMLKLKTPLSGQIISETESYEIGYLPQQTAFQKDFPASVREIVRSGCLNRRGVRPYYNRAEKLLAERYMEKTGISDLAKRCYRELSGGQQQRTLLARALCSSRKMLFLDEPAAGLDPKAAAEMYVMIKEANDSGITIVMISHDVVASVKYASHILHLGGRGMMFFGTVEAYLESEPGRIYTALGRGQDADN